MTRPAIIQPLLLPQREAAAALSISVTTLASLTEPKGPIPCVRLGRSVRYAVRDLEAWIESQKSVVVE